MTQNNIPVSLKVGTVLRNTFALCRSHLKSYLGITFRSLLWSSAIFLIFIVGMGLIGLLSAVLISMFGEGSSPNPLLGLLIFILIIGLIIGLFYGSFFCTGKSAMNLALISRLAYHELANKPELVHTARQQISSRHWEFFKTQLLVNLLLFGINLGLQIAQSFVLIPAQLIFGQESVIAAIIALLVLLASTILYLWFLAHWFIPEVPLAVENNLTSTLAIERSWNLSKQNVWQIWLIIFVAGLITIPLYLIIFGLAVLPAIPSILVMIQSEDWSTLENSISLLSSVISAYFLAIFLSVIVGFFITPFWQTMKGVIYYLLRSPVDR
ncbi:MAG: hypothetical protein SWJ54_00175 [Cyanobacteriota bacterium]|nr:hypothetical protein [Cyanobacteriota bacterium]